MSEANLLKLLRTLKNYEAELLILPAGRSPVVCVGGEWITIEDHPEISNNVLLDHLKEVLNERILEDLENGLEIIFEHSSERFILLLQDNHEGKTLIAQRLKAIPEDIKSLLEFPEIEKWLKLGHGILQVKDSSTYAAILRYVSQRHTEPIVSLERLIKYPAKSFLGLIEQRELGEHFSNIEEGINAALQLNPGLIALNEIKGENLIEKLSSKIKILILQS